MQLTAIASTTSSTGFAAVAKVLDRLELNGNQANQIRLDLTRSKFVVHEH